MARWTLLVVVVVVVTSAAHLHPALAGIPPPPLEKGLLSGLLGGGGTGEDCMQSGASVGVIVVSIVGCYFILEGVFNSSYQFDC